MQLPPHAAGAAARQNSLSHRSVGTSMFAVAAGAPAGDGASPPRPRPARQLGRRAAITTSSSASRMAGPVGMLRGAKALAQSRATRALDPFGQFAAMYCR